VDEFSLSRLENILFKKSIFLFQKVNRKTKNGHFLCPFFKSAQGLLEKSVFLLHNEKLASDDFLNFFYFVTIIFLLFFLKRI